MAWEDVGNVISQSAGAAITTNRFVKIGASDNTVILAAASTDISIGVAKLAAAASGDPVPVQVDGVARVEAGAAVTLGALVMADSVGRAIDATATNRPLGIALEAAAAAGVIISVLLKPEPVF